MMRKWSETELVHERNLRRKMALSFGDFKTEGRVRADLIKAIRACDESRIGKIKVPGYDKRQTMTVLQRDGAYQYTQRQIAERRTVIENQLRFLLPRENLEPVRREVFNALKLEKAGVELVELPPDQRSKLRDSGLLDYVGLRF